jgi:hypothetical protein
MASLGVGVLLKEEKQNGHSKYQSECKETGVDEDDEGGSKKGVENIQKSQ